MRLFIYLFILLWGLVLGWVLIVVEERDGEGRERERERERKRESELNE